MTQEVRDWNSGSSTDTLTYGYTNNNQLTSVSHTDSSFSNESFSYDANGNQTGTGYTTSTGNEQTASPGYTYTYDADGNLITMTQTSTGDVWTYTYDFRNRLVGAMETSGSTTLEQVTYTYDALDNRIGMDENGTQTWTLYDGSDPIMDFNSSGSLEMRYLNGPAGDLVDTVLARQTSGGTVSWYLPDRLGTIRDLINSSGSIIDHVDYTAFGTVLDESSSSNGDRLMVFAGMERDTITGLNLAVERAENPTTGRWDSQDPLAFAAGDANLERYVGNDSPNSVDPFGLQEGQPVKGAGPEIPEPKNQKPKNGDSKNDNPPQKNTGPFGTGQVGPGPHASPSGQPSQNTGMPVLAPDGSIPGPLVTVNPDGSGGPGLYKPKQGKTWLSFSGCNKVKPKHKIPNPAYTGIPLPYEPGTVPRIPPKVPPEPMYILAYE